MNQFIISILLLIPTLSWANTRPLKVAVFGDSITAATFANERFGYPSPRFYSDTQNVVKQIIYYALLGTEITPKKASTIEAFNRITGYYRRTHYSFLLGRADYTLRAKVRRKLGVDVDIVDLTLVGTGYEHSDIALRNLKNNVKQTKVAPDLIVVNYTAMDFLYNKSVDHESWEHYYTDELKELVYNHFKEDFDNFGYAI